MVFALLVECIDKGKLRLLKEKPAPVPLCPPVFLISEK
jgi:hypothetical protein